MQDIAQHHSGRRGADGLCSQKWLVLRTAHCFSPPLSSSRVLLPSICTQPFPWLFFKLLPQTSPREHPFFQLVPLVLENFLQFLLHLLQQTALPRPPAPQQAEPLAGLFLLFFISSLVVGGHRTSGALGK